MCARKALDVFKKFSSEAGAKLRYDSKVTGISKKGDLSVVELVTGETILTK